MLQDMENILMWVISIEHIYFLIYLTFLIAVLVSEKTPEGIVAWIFTITVFPVAGIVLYLIFGINWRKNKIDSLQKNPRKGIFPGLFGLFNKFMEYDPSQIFHSLKLDKREMEAMLDKTGISEKEKEIVRLLYHSEGTYLTENGNYKMFYEGKEAFDSIIDDLEKAKESIYMEYFIWRSDELGERIKKVLLRKAKEGLKIKLLFDGMGSFGTISRKYRKELEEAGVEFKYFLDIKFALSKLNYRNHRKMTIIDNRILHTGGMNLGKEYITGGKKFDYWRDTNIKIEGEIVLHYLAIFIIDWLNSRGKSNFDFKAVEEALDYHKNSKKENSYLMQVSSSGPDTVWTSLKYMYSKMILAAEEEILIQSPYFIPDMSLLNDMKIAALSGVKIKLMIAGVPDKKIPYWIAETYFSELLLTGVEIYRYKKGFLHCKNIVTDGKFSTMGTCNFDIRSFEINYEVNSVFYDREISQNMRKQFYEDLKYCEEIKEERLKRIGFWNRLRNSVFRLLSPLM